MPIEARRGQWVHDEAGVTRDCETAVRAFWELNSDPLEEHQALLGIFPAHLSMSFSWLAWLVFSKCPIFLKEQHLLMFIFFIDFLFLILLFSALILIFSFAYFGLN